MMPFWSPNGMKFHDTAREVDEMFFAVTPCGAVRSAKGQNEERIIC